MSIPAVASDPDIGIDDSVEHGKGPSLSEKARRQLEAASEREKRARAALGERLRSPAAVDARERSLTAHRGLGDSEALSLLDREFDHELESPMPDAAELADGGRIDGFLDDRTMRVDGEGSKPMVLVEAPYALRAPEPEAGGKKEPVEVDLESAGSAYVPETSSVDVTVPKDLEAGIKLDQIRIFPEGDAPGDVVDSDVVAYPNAAKDTDVVVRPLPIGVETFAQLRSPAAPETQRFRVSMPAGASLRETPEDGAEVVRDGRRLAYVHPPSAVDAQGREVEAEYGVDGATLVVSVPHRRREVAYPILLDPIYEDYSATGNGSFTQTWQQGHRLDGLAHFAFESNVTIPPDYWNTYAGRGTCVATLPPCYSGAYNAAGQPTRADTRDGLHIYVRPAVQYPTNSYGQFVYTAPGTTSTIEKADILHSANLRWSAAGPVFVLGLFSPSALNWSHLIGIGQSTNQRSLIYGGPTYGRIPARQFTFTAWTFGASTATAWKDAYIGGIRMDLTDPEPPTRPAAMARSSAAARRVMRLGW